MSEPKMVFLFTDEARDNKKLTAYNYKLYKSIISKMKYKKLRDEIDSELCMLYCKFREVCYLMGFKDTHSPETYGLTEAKVKNFLLTDKYLSANLLLKCLAEEKKKALNEARKIVIAEFNEKMKVLKEFTNGGQKKFDNGKDD